MRWTNKQLQAHLKGKLIPSDTASITNSVLKFMATQKDWKVWRQNNTGVYDKKLGKYRAFTGLKGVSDIIGINLKTGVWFACEVKGPGDRVSKEQTEFLLMIQSAGGFACVARSFDGFVKDFKEYLNER